MQGALGFDVGAGTGWGLQMSLKAYTPRAVTIAVGSLSWWGSEASVGVRGAYDLWGVASWEWSVIAGGRITALSARGLEQTGPAVAFAPIAGASLGLRVALSDRWWLLGEVGFTAQPWEERWLVAGGGTVPVSWFSGALSVGVQRTFL